MLTMLLSSAVSAAEPDWSALEGSGWVEVTTKRSPEGPIAIRSRSMELVGCVEGAVQVDVAPEALLAVTADMVSAPSWSSASIPISEELERDATGFVLFQLLDVPGWTLSSDRYWTIRGEPMRTATGARYRWHRVDPSGYPGVAARVGRAIEPPINYGEWRFDAALGGGTDLRYRSCADFGGRVPTSIQRWLNTQQLPGMVAELVTEARRRAL